MPTDNHEQESARRQRWALTIVQAATSSARRAETARIEALHRARREGCTQEEIAQAAGITRQAVAYHLRQKA